MENAKSHLKLYILSMKANLAALQLSQVEGQELAIAEEAQHQAMAVDNDAQRILQIDLQWPALVATFCFSSALQTGPSIDQTRKDDASFSSSQFHLFRTGLVLAVSSLFMAKHLSLRFPNIASLLERMGVFFGVTAFFIAVTESFPPGLKIASWTIIYAIVLLVAFFCRIFEPP